MSLGARWKVKTWAYSTIFQTNESVCKMGGADMCRGTLLLVWLLIILPKYCRFVILFRVWSGTLQNSVELVMAVFSLLLLQCRSLSRANMNKHEVLKLCSHKLSLHRPPRPIQFVSHNVRGFVSLSPLPRNSEMEWYQDFLKKILFLKKVNTIFLLSIFL